MKQKKNYSTGQKVIIFFCAFIITFISICNIFKNDISFLLLQRKVERKYGNSAPNSYYIEDNFEYVNNYEKLEVNSKQDIIDSIYYLINSGITYSERYCGKNYTNCYNDMNEISNNDSTLSILNNFVHPYNTYNSIKFSFNDEIIKITITHTYTENEIKEINNKVDTIIKENITNNMTIKEKIKIVHDYIINNTDYDTLKTENINDTTYKSNTAYGVLLEGFGICSGYSDAMKIFLDRFNIVNYKINNDEHIWNLVQLNSKWYHLDLTWDDPISDKNITRDNYFLIDNNTLKLLKDNEHDFNGNIFKEAIK
ncbi:MAG: hypothetical protein IJI49_02370 [Bacilli bacterium]|nr:hypothetical protein [Bacilli bacterium]